MRRTLVAIAGLVLLVISSRVSVCSGSLELPAAQTLSSQRAVTFETLVSGGAMVRPEAMAVPVSSAPTGCNDCSAYSKDQCTYWACTRATATGWAGLGCLHHAYEWDDNAPGQGFVVDSVPMGGSIAVWDNCDGIAGHVAFVEDVTLSGQIHISELNWCCDGCCGDGCCEERTITPPSCLRYIYRPQPTLFEHVDYAGAWHPLTTGITDFAGLTFTYPEGNGIGLNDAVSSIWMPPLWDAIYFKEHDYGCGSILFDCPNDNLHALQFTDGMVVGDNGSSIKVSNQVCFLDWECGGQYAGCTGPGNGQALNMGSAPSSHTCPPQPPPTPPPPSVDDATLVADITIPDGTVVTPGQALHKVWRVRNSGTSTWGSGYQLAFTGGDQMGAPSAVNVPATAPGATADIAVDMTAPADPGNYQGNWRMRNAQGTHFGDHLWVQIQVEDPSGYITTLTADPPSPSNASVVRIHARVEGLPNFRAMRILIDGNVVYELGAPEIYYDWSTDGYASGEHSIVAEATDFSDPNWSRAERKGVLYTFLGGGAPGNHPPDRPSLQSPYDWYVTIGNPPELCSNLASDPDGDAVQYFLETSASQGSANSGWISSRCWTPPSQLDPGTYEWHVKARDEHGAESGWSDPWHYSVESSGVTITELYFEPLDPNQEQVRIRACTSGHGGVNITLNVRVNTAPDGSDSGEWRIIKELGVPCFNQDDAPVWNTLDCEDGTHLVRVVATAVEPAASDVRDEVYTLNHRRPGWPTAVRPVYPEHYDQTIWLNSRTVDFAWQPGLRATQYRLCAGLDPEACVNPILDVTLDGDATGYTYTFGQDYEHLHWQVFGINDKGSTGSGNAHFGIDRTVPGCTVQALPDVSYESVFQVTWAGTDNAAGVREYDVQYLDTGRGDWSDWLTAVQASKTYDLFTGLPGHTYGFRCRSTDNADNTGVYPADPDTSTTIDPTARPPAPWWNGDYTEKRNAVILNNMGNLALPAGYPVLLHFDSSTTPSAAQIYNASQSNPKCNDLRIIYSDTTQLDRVVQACSDTRIDIWFRTQVSVPPGSSDGTSHQLYYGYAGAGSPPGSPTTVFDPPADANTVGLWYMDEGGGLTLHDASGFGNNCSLDTTSTWVTPAKFSGAVHFLGGTDGPTANCGASSVFNLQTFTFEMWLKRTGAPWGRLAGHLGGGQNRWLFTFTDSAKIRVSIWPCADCGAEEFTSNTAISDTAYWHHVAFSLEDSVVRIYIDGQLDSTGQVVWGNIRSGTPPLTIGSAEGAQRIFAETTHVRLSNSARPSFPYGAFAAITSEPTTAAGEAIQPPGGGAADLVVLGMTGFAVPQGGVLVQAVMLNQGDTATTNGFYTDLYVNHVPAGPGDYAGSISFWVDDPIEPGATVTLTAVIDDLGQFAQTNPLGETSATLYTQADSDGVIAEPDDQNNISAGLEVCVASPDAYEEDDTVETAQLIALGQTQTHNFAGLGDQDWLKFTAQAGASYSIGTSNLGPTSDTYLYLYDTDGTTLLSANDDYGGSLASYVEWTASAAGTYYVLVKHWNPNAGGCGTAYDVGLYETVYAGFSGTPTSGVVPLEVSFSNESGGDFDSNLWNFGDGITDTLESPAHVYTETGTYTVTVTVSGRGGTDELTRPSYITVSESAPDAAFSANPTSGLEPLSVQFTDESTGTVTGWLWDFGDGQTSALQHPSHAYAQPGTFTVSQTVSGPGGTDTLTRPDYITVYEIVLSGFSGSPTSGPAPLLVSFTNQSVGDYDTCAWTFGDGATSNVCNNPEHTYTTAGVYTVALTVSGPGGTDTLTRPDYVAVYHAVHAGFMGNPTSGIAPFMVSFTNQSTGDYDTCAWTFGDGGTSNNCNNPTHTYSVAGAYTVALTVSGPGGTDTLTRTDYITVYEPVNAGFTASPTGGAAPLWVAFTNQSSGDYDTCAWSFGDGGTSNNCNNPTHTYTAAGAYTVALTVSGPGGTNTLTRPDYITVYEAVNAGFAGSPTGGAPPLLVAFTNQSSGDYDTCAWTFGDGGTSDDCDNPTHTYAVVGVYTVALTVSGPGGTDTLTRPDYITVAEGLHAAFTGNPTDGGAPLLVSFTNSSTGDYDTCTWSFGDGGTSDDCNNPTHTYAVVGVYTVALTVSGPGGTDTLTRSNYITVYEQVNAGFTGGPTSGLAPLLVSFTNESTGDFDGCTWDFGDGGTSNVCNNPPHTYTVAGVYNVALTVSGPGGSDTLTRPDYITVYEPVSADFVGYPTSGLAPLQVLFTNGSTGDYDTCSWTFGDGGTSNDCNNPVHTYTIEGTYTVTLAVSGYGGNDTMIRQNYVTVQEEYRCYLPIILRNSPSQRSGREASEPFMPYGGERPRRR